MWDGTVRRTRPEKVCRDALANRLSRRRRRRETRADPREKKFLHFPRPLSFSRCRLIFSGEIERECLHIPLLGGVGWRGRRGGGGGGEATLSGPHFPPSWRKPAARHFSFPSLEEEPPPPGVELMHALLLFYLRRSRQVLHRAV